MATFRFILPQQMKKYVLLVIGCTGLGVLLFIFIHYSESGMLASPRLLWKKYLLLIALSNALGVIVFQLDRIFDRLLDWKNNFLFRFISGLVTNSITVLLITSFAGNYLFNLTPEEILKLNIVFVIANKYFGH